MSGKRTEEAGPGRLNREDALLLLLLLLLPPALPWLRLRGGRVEL